MNSFKNKYQPRLRNGKYASYTYIVKLIKWITTIWKKNQTSKQKY